MFEVKTLVAILILGAASSGDFRRVTVIGYPEGMRLPLSVEIPRTWKELDVPGSGFHSPSDSYSFVIERLDLALAMNPELPRSVKESQEISRNLLSKLRAKVKAGVRGYTAVRTGNYDGVISEHSGFPDENDRLRARYWAFLKGPKPFEWINATMLAKKVDVDEKDRKLFRHMVRSIKPE